MKNRILREYIESLKEDNRCTDDRFFGGTKGVVINGG